MAFQNDGTLIDTLLRLTRSPQLQVPARQIKGMIPSVLGRPFGGKAPIVSSSQRKPSGPSGLGQAGASIGASLGRLLGGGGQPQQQELDPMTQLYMQLVQQLQSPVDMPTGIDTGDLMNQVRGALDPIYDQRISGAQSEYKKGSSEIQGMYGQLAEEYKKMAPVQKEQAAMAQQEIEQLYGQLRSNIEGTYSRVSNEQAELFKQLGIEDALPSVLDKQDDAVLEASKAASEMEAQQKQRYMDMGEIDQTYFREGAPLAKTTGNELSSDLLFQLNQYVNQTNAERSAGIQSAYLDQLGNAQGLLQNQQQLAMQENARRQSMLFEMLQAQMSGKQQQMTPDSLMASLDPNTQSAVAGAFTQLQRSPEAIYGKVEDPRSPVPGTFVETTPEWYLAQADELLKRGQITPEQHQALLMYIQLSMSQ